MKRWFSLALVALLLVPVLVVPAAASEVYVFEVFERPVVLQEFEFPEFEDSAQYVYEGIVPPGIYSVYVDDVVTHNIVLSFDQYNDEDGFYYSYVNLDLSGVMVPAIFCHIDGVTLAMVDDVSGLSLKLERTGDLPSQGGFTSMFEDFSAFTGSCVNFVSEVAKTITGSPLLLLTCGFLFLGGCIGITGRLLSRG